MHPHDGMSWVGEVKCFSMVCVGGDHPLTRGSLEPLRHICLYSNWYSLAHQYEAFLQSEHSSQDSGTSGFWKLINAVGLIYC